MERNKKTMVHNDTNNTTNNETKCLPTLHTTLRSKPEASQHNNATLHFPAMTMLQGTDDTKHGLVEQHARATLEHEETTRQRAVVLPLSLSVPTQCNGGTVTTQNSNGRTRRIVRNVTLCGIAALFAGAALIGQSSEVVSAIKIVLHVLGVR